MVSGGRGLLPAYKRKDGEKNVFFEGKGRKRGKEKGRKGVFGGEAFLL